MLAVVADTVALGKMINIHIRNDPFPTYVDRAQLELLSKTKGRQMPSKAEIKKMNPRELRQLAREEGVSDWEVMDRDQLVTALVAATSGDGKTSPSRRGSTKSEDSSSSDNDSEDEDMPTARKATGARKAAPAKKAAAAKKAPAVKKAPAKKTPVKAPAKAAATKTKRAAPTPPQEYEGPNPFRPGSNLFKICEALMVGGKNADIVKKLGKTLEYKPRVKAGEDFDVDAETDRRMKIVGYILKKEHGFEYIYDTSNGRGGNAFIKVVPPK